MFTLINKYGIINQTNSKIKRCAMKNRILYWFSLLWSSLIAFFFPLCFYIIFTFITGHSKGYAYDLGSEKDISIILGCFALLIWLVLALPSNIYLFVKTAKKCKFYLLIPIVLFIILATLGLFVYFGSWAEFSRLTFNI